MKQRVSRVTGEKVLMELELEDVDRELFELAREWISATKVKKLPCHVQKPTDVALWKQFRMSTQNKGTLSVLLF